LETYRRGGMVIIADRADRENEGDLVVATECITPEQVAFMMREARGLICVSLSSEVAEQLDLPLQVVNNNSPFGTAFTVSIDHRSVASEGVTAIARAQTMRALVDDAATAEEFISPGNVFPLVANPAGVLGREGQTEGSHDLSQLAGLKHSGVICEILNPDGTMARGKSLEEFAVRHRLPITTVDEIIRYRISREVLVREVGSREVDTDFGRFVAHAFINDADGKEHMVLTYGEQYAASGGRGCLVRIHSECLTGDVFGSQRCDCGPQLALAMEAIVKEGSGALVYLRQEGRGIGLLNKLKAYALQDAGHDTVEANVKLGFAPDERDFRVAGKILQALGIERIRLLTNNPVKVETLTACGIDVLDRVPVLIPPNPHSQGYLRTKREKLGHIL
ncbi:MAG: GTP cyclohydrolase II, partial [Proteobacteria bacterium]|nr:GTP cyclohydrolase II [Pseudomonadota bacterium]